MELVPGVLRKERKRTDETDKNSGVNIAPCIELKLSRLGE